MLEAGCFKCLEMLTTHTHTHTHRFVFLSLFAVLTHIPSVVTQAGLSVTSTLPPPTPGPFNPRECSSVFDNIHQVIYVCAEHPELYPILKYAERLAQEECENSFQDELWNCSNFSLLKEPNITSGGKQHSYIHTLTHVQRMSVSP